MDDLITFLRARLDEREALAKATTPVPVPGRWIATRDKHAADDAPLALVQGRDELATDTIFEGDYVSGSEVIVFSAEWQDEAEANLRFIADNDPAFVLADVAAKRQLVEEHSGREVASLDRDTWGRPFVVCRRCTEGTVRQVVAPCPTLKLLALPYVDHPEYREEWRP
ncbi:DUF6221 family protein [Amycolatopsis sp. NPDC088138]|uniref:DUF6221 family protein n=1 Tax=Amycolatopsis sp. NPDC088138 TaxID=3363938 RepID=UPI0037F74234